MSSSLTYFVHCFYLAAGEDYDAISEAVVFNSESVLVQPLCVEINITDDDVVESIEQLSVTLTSLSPDQLSDDTPQATVTIKDDNDSKLPTNISGAACTTLVAVSCVGENLWSYQRMLLPHSGSVPL